MHRVLVGKPEGKRPLGRPRRRWEDNIKMDLQKVGGGGDWMELAQDMDMRRALVNTVMNFRVPYNAGNFSRRTLLDGVSIIGHHEVPSSMRNHSVWELCKDEEYLGHVSL